MFGSYEKITNGVKWNLAVLTRFRPVLSESDPPNLSKNFQIPANWLESKKKVRIRLHWQDSS
jgi:hypothetical protein